MKFSAYNNLFTLALIFFVFSGWFLACQAATVEEKLYEDIASEMSIGNYSRALLQLNSLPENHVNQLPSLYLQSQCLKNLGKHEESRQLISRIMTDFGYGENAGYTSVVIAALSAVIMKDGQGAVDLIGKTIPKYQKSPKMAALLYSLRGMILLQAHSQSEAVDDFSTALQIDKQNLLAQEGLMLHALERRDYNGVLSYSSGITSRGKPPVYASAAERILCIDSFARAVYCRGMVHLLENDISEASKALSDFQQSTGQSSLHPYAVGLGAGVAWLKNSDSSLQRYLESAKKHCPGSDIPYLTLGRLSLMSRRGIDAEKYLRRAVLVDVRSAKGYWYLGEHLLRDGRVEEARENLNRAILCDPFLAKAATYLSVVEHMAKDYATYAISRNIVLRSPTAQPELFYSLPQLIIDTSKVLAGKYEYVHKKTLIIEVHPDARKLALRAIALPWLPARGVCFGRVVTVLSPVGSTSPFGVDHVLAHEMSHSYTLARSKGRIPRWLTEGLAQIDENRARPEDYTRAFKFFGDLRQLLPLAHFDRAFLRPRDLTEAGAAYYQAWLVTQWIIDRFGFRKILSLLDGLADGTVAPPDSLSWLGVKDEVLTELEAFLYTHSDELPVRPMFHPMIVKNQDIFAKDKVEKREGYRFHEERALYMIQTLAIRAVIKMGPEEAQKAWPDIKNLLKKEKRAELYAFAGEAAYVAGKPQRALSLLNRAVSKGDNSVDTLMACAQVMESLGKEKEAEDLLFHNLTTLYPSKEVWSYLYLLASRREGLVSGRAPLDSRTYRIMYSYCQKRTGNVLFLGRLSESHSGKDALFWAKKASYVSPSFELNRLNAHKEPLFFFPSEKPGLPSAVKAVLEGDSSGVASIVASIENASSPVEKTIAIRAMKTVWFDYSESSNVSKWWTLNQRGNFSALLRDQMQEAGFSLSGMSFVEKAGVLILALEDSRWYVRLRALSMLQELSGVEAYKNALWPPNLREKEYNYSKDAPLKAYSELSKEVSSYWQSWLKKQL